MTLRPLLSLGILLAITLNLGASSAASPPLVYISAFAAGDEGAIHAFELSSAGQLQHLHQTADAEHPFFLALSPDRKFLYAIHALKFGGKEHEQVAAYAVGERGQLRLLNRQSAQGTAACYLDVDAAGKTVLVANYSTGSVASLPVQPDGSLGKPQSFFQHRGSSVDPARQKGPHAHCIVVSPCNRFAYAADLGLDQVLAYRLKPGGKIAAAPRATARTPAGTGPRHLTFHPDGNHVYVINELANSVTHFNFESDAGRLTRRSTVSTLPTGFEGVSHCADLKITPNGRFLYGTNRGHDSIASFQIADDGELTRLNIVPSLGKGPQNLAINANGTLLLCANMPGNNVAVFRIDPTTGKLQSTGPPVATKSPSCIMIP